MKGIQKICGGRIVTPSGTIEQGTLVIENGTIIEISSSASMPGPRDIDASGMLVLSGIIDTHSDAIEHEMQPRPSSLFPVEMSFYELERKLAGQGVTTIYHSLSMWDDNSAKEVRRNQSVKQMIRTIRRLAAEDHLIRHKVHLRFEIVNLNAVPHIVEMLNNGELDQLSFMDHTPGQGQYRNLEVQKKFVMERQKLTEEETLKVLEARRQQPKVSREDLQLVADLAGSLGVPLASHDDDSVEKLELVQSWRAAISEFPITMDVAKEAKQRGLHVVMGAPNVMLGRSHSNNLSALDAIKEGVVDILCSDYYPPAMIQAAFLLHNQGYELSYAMNMISLNPAKALGLDKRLGSLEEGKAADVLLTRIHNGRPVIEKVWVEGQTVCQMDYRMNAAAAVR
ncbi:alpha-D-ribose 1-methylphosphonate 5-triphosphate diphosphatase [Paenibacillus sp. H1-7]|uniref:alpha-D-ribose 1-methylphosphonate 5-triphosphate diphosphatase n=1 Tax=Paenibacillus sp. H1-7 TaxID=2282849 RepID=UPI001EF7EB63|nr:alpha-D-ribose 1-methylphosphonate 5-triphosphate diphosphatase [Paenibacillus sp. H1-7]ULL15259.1 alpha-D-ribose 1-methylphosphonate 5-triphosphate diphosphatase [Paenibacillus sp. H1-7]